MIIVYNALTMIIRDLLNTNIILNFITQLLMKQLGFSSSQKIPKNVIIFANFFLQIYKKHRVQFYTVNSRNKSKKIRDWFCCNWFYRFWPDFENAVIETTKNIILIHRQTWWYKNLEKIMKISAVVIYNPKFIEMRINKSKFLQNMKNGRNNDDLGNILNISIINLKKFDKCI